MALKGTIKDFGVADIFQLISQQVKTGVLVLNNEVDEVRVYFRDGSVVRAENTTRPGDMRLGNLLLRADAVNQSQLEAALREQKRTLKRVGRVMLDLGHVDEETITEFAALQMTETIYSLFEWKVGTYLFQTAPVEPSPDGIKPIRAEAILMNGIRMTDEWPEIRERIPSYGWQVQRVRPLPPRSNDDDEDGFNLSVFDEAGGISSDGGGDIGDFERRAYELIAPGRTVQKIIDLSRLGEFEACRALSNLMTEGFVRIIKPAEANSIDLQRAAGISTPRAREFAQAAARILLSATLVVVISSFIARSLTQVERHAGRMQLSTTTTQSHLAETQLRVIRRALEVYRLQNGKYPGSLDALIAARLVSDHDVRTPFRDRYYYRLTSGKFVLLPPVL